MEPRKEDVDVFSWTSEGLGLGVGKRDVGVFAHEDLFSDAQETLSGSSVFVGTAIPNWRYIAAIACVCLLAFGLLARAFWMQVVQGSSYQALSENNRLRHEVVPSKRGIIRDRSGAVLADNVPSFDLELTPWYLPTDPEERDELLFKIGREIHLDLSDIYSTIASSTDPAQRMTLRRDIPYEQAIGVMIAVGDQPGVHIAYGSKRRYPMSLELQSLSHVLGYVGSISPSEYAEKKPSYRQTDVLGKTGIESSYEQALRGVPGEKVYEVDAHGKIMSLVGDYAAEEGKDVWLSIDAELQRATEESLARQLAGSHLSRGAAVAMDPQSGAILAIVSLPAYNNNLFSGTVSSTAYAALIKDENRPLLPRAWAGTYPSGSTVKPVIAAAGLAEKVITPKTTVLSVGGIRIGDSFFPDWKAGGHGTINVRSAIAWSVNTFFYYLGGGYQSFIGLGVDRLSSWMQKFGLGSKTGIDVPGENPGFVPTKEWKEQVRKEHWYIGDTYNLSIGQGDLLVTPLQVAAFTAAIANGGLQVRPHFLLTYGDGMVVATTSTNRLADVDVIRTVQQGMRENVTYGSGRALSSLPFTAAGKTGTAQWRNDKPTHAWFTAYAPFEKPEIVVTVLIEEGGEGSSVSVPVAKEILEAWNRGTRGE